MKRDESHSLVCGLYAIVDHAFVEPLLEGGCRLLQLRMKGAPEDDVRRVAQNIAALKQAHCFTFIVNDHASLAAEIGADGVHIGKDDDTVASIRDRFGEKLLIGYSSHSLQEAILAEREGADYVAFGAISPTTSKPPGHPVQGVERLREVVKALNVPVVAIGGIDARSLPSVLETGVNAVAMISALTRGENLVRTVQSYVDSIGKFQTTRSGDCRE